MLDYELIKLFRPIIVAGLAAQGLSTVAVIESEQPTQQGFSSGRTVYYTKITDHRYGFPHRARVWDPDTETMIRTVTQQYETQFQIDGSVIQDPASTTEITASDLVNTVALIMQSEETVATLQAAGVGIYRITDVRNPYSNNDASRHQAFPSFDFTLTHKQVTVTTDPVVDTINFGLYPV